MYFVENNMQYFVVFTIPFLVLKSSAVRSYGQTDEAGYQLGSA
jgi:hypothetical protein